MDTFNQRADRVQGAGRARVLIVDNAELFRRGLRASLAGDARFAVAGEVRCFEELLEAHPRLRPDATLLSSSDIEATALAVRSLRSWDVQARVVVLIAPEQSLGVTMLVQAGARGILLRDAPVATVLDALADVCDGGSALDARLARMLFETLADAPQTRQDENSALDPRVLSLLSHREREVLHALALGYRNKQIGAELGVSVGTVKTHLRHIFRKLQVVDRTGAVLKALDVDVRKVA